MHQPEANRTAAIQLGQLVSIQIAQPEQIRDAAGVWQTAFFKRPVTGPVIVGATNIEGDGQADRKHHGGVDKAVMAYSADHYPKWTDERVLTFGEGEDPLYGGFGENLTIAGLDETTVCIGDRWKIGEVTLEVSQPRQPCWKLGRRWSVKMLPKLVIQNGRSGWYFRVVATGKIEAGQSVELVTRPQPDWSVQRANEVYYRGSAEQREELRRLPELSAAWRDDLA